MPKPKSRSLGTTVIIFLGLLNIAGVPRCPGVDRSYEENCDLEITEAREGDGLAVGAMPRDPNQPCFAYTQLDSQLHNGFSIGLTYDGSGNLGSMGIHVADPNEPLLGAGFSVFNDPDGTEVMPYSPEGSIEPAWFPDTGRVNLRMEQNGDSLDFFAGDMDPNSPQPPTLLGSGYYPVMQPVQVSFSGSSENGQPFYISGLEIEIGNPTGEMTQVDRVRHAVDTALARKTSAWNALNSDTPDWAAAGEALDDAFTEMMMAMEIAKQAYDTTTDPQTGKKIKALKKAFKSSKKGMKKVGSLLKKVGKKKKPENLLKAIQKEIGKEGKIRVQLEGL